MKDQKQTVEGGGTAIQAAGDVIINTGLSVSDVKAIAMDVFHAHMEIMRGKARETSRLRGEKITNDFFEELQKKNPEGIQQGEDPDFQDALFTVQKEYAKVGDEELGKLLVGLLVDRTKQTSRSIKQLVLNESLRTAPKLTNEQVATLAAIFSLRYTVFKAMSSHHSLKNSLTNNALPLAGKVSAKESSFQHLQYAGCGAKSLVEVKFEGIFLHHYPGLFFNGFSAEAVQSSQISIPISDTRFFVACLNDPEKFQINAIHEDVLKSELEKHGAPEEDWSRMTELYGNFRMSEPDIQKKLLELCPGIAPLIAAWNGSSMKSFELTSIGIAIGHAYTLSYTNNMSSLSAWLE